MLWVYDLATWQLFVLIVGGFAAAGVAGLYASRSLVARIAGEPPNHNEGVDVFIGAVAVLYGLVAGLLAVAVWEQYATIDGRVSAEASGLGALYRQVQAFPEPQRTNLSESIRQLTYDTMTRGWAQQRRGAQPLRKNPTLDALTSELNGFSPKDLRESNVQSAAIAEFQRVYELRRQRLHDTSAGVPASLYAVVFVGALLTIVLTYFLALERFGMHVSMTLVMSAMIGLVVFVIVAMDHPFRGGLSIGPDAFEEEYTALMGGTLRL